MRLLLLVLPILLPAWRFFKTVEASPRIEWSAGQGWQPLFPPPARVNLWQILARLFWNPQRNDALFMVSCAERRDDTPTDHSVAEIRARVRRVAGGTGAPLQFRVIFVWDQDASPEHEVAFLSDPFPP